VDRAPQSWWRTVVCGMALAICSLMFCLLAIEAVARTFRLLPPPSQNFRFSPTKGYELVPGHKEINSHGLRDREYSVVKPPHTFRILALGDPFTYGDGVALEETWVKGLERRLNQQLGDTGIHFEVLNAGIPGYNTHQELIHLQDVGLQFDPNLVVVEFTLNDAELGMMGLKDVKKHLWLISVKEWLKSHFALYAFFKRRMSLLLNRLSTAELGEAIGGSTALPARDPLRLAAKGQITEGWELCRRSLQEIAATVRARDTPVVLVIFPLLVDLTDTSYPFKAEHALVAKAGSESRMVVLDLLPEFLGLEPSSLWAAPTDSHPNARAHAIAVAALYRTLLAHMLIPHTVPAQRQTQESFATRDRGE
jgi:hypothetical protein